MTEPFVVLQSFPVPRPTTNPYVIMLGRSLADLPDVEVRNFRWKTALCGRYDVMHVHWPEILVSGRTPVRKLVRQGLFCALLLRLHLSNTPLVRTVHNLDLPQGISRRETALLNLAERQATLLIRLNDSTAVDPMRAQELILHGHYRDWFASYRKQDPISGRITFFGLIRRYKGVDTLVRAFAETAAADSALSLRVAGKPSTEALVAELREIAGDDERVSMHLEFLTDSELVSEVTSSSLVVLPYPEMHNSGGVLTALSLGRPVLVRDNVVNERLAAEVGPGWVFRFSPPLTGQTLLEVLAEVQREADRAEPDLSKRNWDDAGPRHLDAYRRAVQIRSTKRRCSLARYPLAGAQKAIRALRGRKGRPGTREQEQS